MGHACAREYIFIYIGTIQGSGKTQERRWTHEKSCICKGY
nr:MAG TPA: Dephospho-CoA kinase [Caudoviricetes sp.]